MRRKRAYRSSGLLRSLTLLRTFLIASAAILAAGAVALSSTLSSDLRRAALADSARDLDSYANAVLAPTVVRRGRIAVSSSAARRLERLVRTPDDILGMNVYTPAGVLAFSTSHPGRVGRRRAIPEIFETIERGSAQASFVEVAGAAPSVVRVYAPLRTEQGRVVGGVEIALTDEVVTSMIDDARWTVWYAVGIVFGVLWVMLAILVRGASMRLRGQNEDLAARSHELLESTRELEATLLETIETLNAAVEARDPYTAGHSQRVRRVALAIGRELRLPARQLGSLATASLFHDIGKIGIPDSILTKPEKLDRSEAAVMREHVTRGAEIVARISSLRESVPAIRHHHERWDGLGYPDRLSGRDIPVEASIIALADAWDAMTTDRPYARALDVTEALLQIQAGRGKQFSPAVVDAFLAVSRRRPGDIAPPQAPPVSAAV